jgi:hypothetical protein
LPWSLALDRLHGVAPQATLLSERLNGVGVVEQLELWNKGLDPVILFTIGSLVVAGLMPRRPPHEAGTQEAAVFDVQNFAGRLSFLGLAATLGAEMVTGKVGGVGARLQCRPGLLAWDGVGCTSMADLHRPILPQGCSKVPPAPNRTLHACAMVQGLLALLQIDTGVELSEVEGVLAFLAMLILTGPTKHTNPRT